MTTTPATDAYFAATARGCVPFDHQRDAYEQGQEDGAAGERKRILDGLAEAALEMGYDKYGELWTVAWPHLARAAAALLLDGDGDA